VPLAQEMSIVRDYLDIEQERLGERLRYTLDTAPEAAGCHVPPFSVQSLVENAVKHGIGSTEEGGCVGVCARLDGPRLRIEVSDSGPGFDLSRAPAGRGLDNLAARLETAFGADAGLEVASAPRGCAVVMHVPVRDDARLRAGEALR
jgi:LytS/YehU family sensor histidine kinase